MKDNIREYNENFFLLYKEEISKIQIEKFDDDKLKELNNCLKKALFDLYEEKE